MSLLDRIAAEMERRRGGSSAGGELARSSIDDWLSDYLIPANEFGYGGHVYPLGLNQTLVGRRTQEIATTLPGYMAALRTCPPAFGAELVRAQVISQARFTFRNRPWSGKARRTFGTSELGILERPWRNATTGELLSRMEWHAGLAGNAYVIRQPNRLRMLRPDWVVLMYGSQQEPEDAATALDGELLGYGYCNGGVAQGRNDLRTLLPDEVAHWSPIPDPEQVGIGMSWITPAVREIQGDRAATEHKLRFFENGATPNMVVKGLTAGNQKQFDAMVDMMESRHRGIRNAYRTLYLAAGADATVVGADLKQLDFKATQGAGETRISVLSRVHPVILGLSEGLSGSSLNAGNFSSARRMFADTWVYPTLEDLCAALAPLVKVPPDAELWFDPTDIPLLREDRTDVAAIQERQAITIRQLVDAGFVPETAVAAVLAEDYSQLKHSGLYSVQLQPPGASQSKQSNQPPAGGQGGSAA